jgi:hypothetical protein
MQIKPKSIRRIAYCLSIGALVITLISMLPGCEKSPPPEQTTTSSSTQGEQPTDGVINPGEYDHDVVYDNGNYEIHWKTDAQYIYFGIKVKAVGWVALGFNTTSNLKNIDYVFGGVANNKAYISDEFSADYHGQHQEDTSLGGNDDVLEFGGKEYTDYTVIEFKRALNTRDTYDAKITPGILPIIWAFGSSDNSSTIHKHRGYGEIEIK